MKKKLYTFLLLISVCLFSCKLLHAQNVGIGSESFTPDPSAMLEVKATDKGMLVPRVDIADLSTAAPVTNPALSLLVYNTNETTGEGFYYWDGNAWVAIGGSGSGSPCNTPSAPIAGTHNIQFNQITWNWGPGSDEPSFFKYNTANDYNSAISVAGNNSLTLDNLNCEQTYTIYVWAYNTCGVSDPLTMQVSTSACPCGYFTVTDIDGNIYNTVQIGNQCWMQENLKVTKNPVGNDITRHCYGNNTSNCDLYGGLYLWNVAMNGSSSSTAVPSGRQGICPNGWHLPSEGEWILLEMSLGGPHLAGYQLKLPNDTWPTWFGNNSSNFAAVPGGMRNHQPLFYYAGSQAYFWTATHNSSSTGNAFAFSISSSANSAVTRSSENKSWALSIRCVKN